MVRVVDDFIPNLFMNRVNSLLEGNTFNWFWNSNTTEHHNDNNFMFTHILFPNESNKSPHFDFFLPIVYIIDRHNPVKDLVRMKLNLYTNQGKRIDHASHYDMVEEGKPVDNVMTTILNFTTCNGGTIIDNEEYKSVQNQALMFDNKTKHSGFTQTDTQRRIVLNIATSHG